MSDRGSFRGRPGGRGGSGGGGGVGGEHRGGRGGGRGGAQGGQAERPKKENILDLTKYMDRQINVKFNGGREGELKTPLCVFLLSGSGKGKGREGKGKLSMGLLQSSER